MKQILTVLFFLVNILLIGQTQQDCTEYPQPIGDQVHDYNNVISFSHEKELEDLLSRFRKKTGVQMAIITRAHLDQKDQETYAREIGNCWVSERQILIMVLYC